MEKIDKPTLRVRVSAKYEASQKGFVPDVTVELIVPHDYDIATTILGKVPRLTFDTYTTITNELISYLHDKGLAHVSSE